MRVLDFPQGSAEWLQARANKVTASRIPDVLSRDRTGKKEGSMRRNYRAQLVCESMTGRPADETGFKSKAMEAGSEREPFAAAAYEILTGGFVDQVGFVLHPTIDRAGASPDRLVGSDGLLEIKCPYPATHLDYLFGGVAPAEYQPQMLWEMACTGRAWCDFVSYNPDFLPQHQLFVIRFPRDDQRIREITAEVTVFLSEVDAMVAKLNALKRKA